MKTSHGVAISPDATRIYQQHEEQISMRERYFVSQKVDLITGKRIFIFCWLSASLGMAILQMLLLAQAWYLSQQAAFTACVAAAWLIGSLLGTRLRNVPRLWGGCLLACALLWLAGNPPEPWHMVFVPPVKMHMLILVTMAVLLGAISTAWISQQRPWPEAEEGTLLLRGLLGTTAGLFIVWVFPALACLLAPLCLIPLLALDSLPAGCSPLPIRGGVTETWINRYWNPERQPVQLERRSLPWNWWWGYLARRDQNAPALLLLTILASGIAVILGSLWETIPTPFAAELAKTHELDKLGWLLAGEFIALIIGSCCLSAARNAISLSSRSIPASWHRRGMSIALCMPVIMGGSLLALALPVLQAPWWLMLCLASFTFADALWSILLPRLRHSKNTTEFVQYTLLYGRDPALLHAQEEHFASQLVISEGILIAVFAPLAGWLADHYGGTAIVLVVAGLALIMVLVISVLAIAAISRIPHLYRAHLLSGSAGVSMLPPQTERMAI
jgi:hypothetical protein